MSGAFEEGTIDADLLGRLLDRHGPALALYAAQWTDAADDCVQEALVELARQRIAPQHVVGWLYRVVKNRALERGARSTAAARARNALDRRSVCRRRSNRRSIAATRLAVVEALDQLETSDREIIVMRIWSGLTYEEIATALSISTSSAHRQYERALEKLRQLLESPCSTKKNRSAHLKPELAALQQQLAGLQLAPLTLDRDHLMFEPAAPPPKPNAKLAATPRIAGAPRWFWPTATALHDSRVSSCSLPCCLERRRHPISPTNPQHLH